LPSGYEYARRGTLTGVTPPTAFPLGAGVSLEELEQDPHPMLARLRESEPVSWIPALDAWLVTRYDDAVRVMRDAVTFTVEDARFSTGQVIGPSMLSLDGAEHERHRRPFVAPFRPVPVRERFADTISEQADRLLDALEPQRRAELRRSFAGPLAATIVTGALGLGPERVESVLDWYDTIVAAVTDITAGREPPAAAGEAFRQLGIALQQAIEEGGQSSLLGAAASDSNLASDQLASNAAVLLFGGTETTEGMIANALLLLLEAPDQLDQIRADPELLDAAIDESLRLEPAAAVVDRYATAAVELEGAEIATGDLVRVSIAGANRDPAVFADPDAFDLRRTAPRGHLAFAQGPHVCVGVHLARLEARTTLATLLSRLPGLRLDPDRPSRIRGLVFRKPPELNVIWDS
jgi:cytochrome P450